MEKLTIINELGEALGNLVSHITLKYLIKFYCICIVWHSDDFQQISELKFTPQIAIDENIQLIWMNFDESLMKESNQSKIVDGINLGCQSFIISGHMAEEFLTIYSESIYKAKMRFANNHMVFLPLPINDINDNNNNSNNNNDNTDNTMEWINTILNHPVILDVPNILIISKSSKDIQSITNKESKLSSNRNNNNNVKNITFDLITSKFIGRFNNTSSILLDTFYAWNITFKQNANLFPDKLSNLEQRIVRLALFNYKPYSLWEEVPSGHGNANAMHTHEEKTLLIDGTESLMLLEFCTKHNCTLEISLGNDEAGEWGEILDNSTGNGVLGSVAERRADVGISALYAWYTVYQFLDFTAPISRTGITCIVPKPRLLAGLYLPAMPFSLVLWLAVFLCFIIGVISLTFIEHYNFTENNESSLNRRPMNDEHFRRIKQQPAQKQQQEFDKHIILSDILIQVGAIFLFQSTNLMSKRSAEMITIGSILLIGMMIGYSYSGGLASIMTVPQYEIPIDNAHQMAERKLNWGATHDAWIFSILLATQPDIIKVLKLFHPIPAEELIKHTTSRDFGFSVERLPYGHYAVGDYITEEALDYLQLMPTDIYYEYALGVTHKTWALRPNLDTLILEIAETGIQRYWELQVVMKHSDNKIQIGVATSRAKHYERHGPISLTPSHIVGSIIILMIGLTISFIVFILELYVNRLKIKNSD